MHTYRLGLYKEYGHVTGIMSANGSGTNVLRRCWSEHVYREVKWQIQIVA